MTVSLKGEYALSALCELASNSGSVPVKIADIAARQKIPQKFLELILANLKQAGFVESKRGAEGGYLLARPASAVTVGEVLRHVDGRPGSKKPRAITPLTELWEQVEQAVSDVVDRTTIEDLVRRWQEKQQRYVPNWEI
jgi:Rrf2 family protein